MNKSELRQIVQTEIYSRMEGGDVINKRWVAQAIVDGQGDVLGDGADFALACAYGYIQDLAGGVIRQIKNQETETSTQYVLPGFEYVRSHYSIVRSDEPLVVPLSLMTLAEVMGKADELEAFGKSAIAHADELRRYAQELSATGTDG